MKPKIIFLLLSILTLKGYSQKLVKTYYDYQHLHLHETYYSEDGNKNGSYTELSEQGGILKQGTFKNDLEEGKWIFKQSDGTPQSEETYKDGIKNGTATYYNIFGTLESTGSYKEGKK